MTKKIAHTLIVFILIQGYFLTFKKGNSIIQKTYAATNENENDKHISNPTSSPTPISDPQPTIIPTSLPQPTPQPPTPSPESKKEDSQIDHQSTSDSKPDNPDNAGNNTPAILSAVTNDPPSSNSDPATHTFSTLFSKVINPPHEFDYSSSLSDFYNSPQMSNRETSFLLLLSAIMSTIGLSLLVFPYLNAEYWEQKKQFNLTDRFNLDI